MPRPFTDRPILARLTPLALVVAAAAFTLTLTPSLVPRSGLLQGAVAGISFALVYGLVAGLIALWRWLGLAGWHNPRLRWLTWTATLAILAVGPPVSPCGGDRGEPAGKAVAAAGGDHPWHGDRGLAVLVDRQRGLAARRAEDDGCGLCRRRRSDPARRDAPGRSAEIGLRGLAGHMAKPRRRGP